MTSLLNQPLAPGVMGAYNTNSHIYGIAVDNNSGSWLQVSSTGSYIPPFTRGWSEDINPGAAQVIVTPVIGPTGQAISTAGTTSYVSVYDKPIGPSSGVPSGNPGDQYAPVAQNLQPTTTAILDVVAAATPGTRVNLVPAVAGQRCVLPDIALVASVSTADFPGSGFFVTCELAEYDPTGTTKIGELWLFAIGGTVFSPGFFNLPRVTAAGNRIDAIVTLSSAPKTVHVNLVGSYYYA